jgi:hypothetical protein
MCSHFVVDATACCARFFFLVVDANTPFRFGMRAAVTAVDGVKKFCRFVGVGVACASGAVINISSVSSVVG